VRNSDLMGLGQGEKIERIYTLAYCKHVISFPQDHSIRGYQTKRYKRIPSLCECISCVDTIILIHYSIP
jgi:hypothetical protein